MDAEELRAAQAPLKARYRTNPSDAVTPVSAVADYRDDGVTCTVEGFAGPVRAGLHPATGGTGDDACSGDLLLEALLACAGVTLRAVATAYGVEIAGAHLRVDGTFDARGTLGLDRDAPVGVCDVVVDAELETSADDALLAKLAAATERYCVVGRSLTTPPTFVVRRAGE
ncbi:OsmC family protein [Nocardioides sp. Soil796]|uniref:OsmC family protein n=1 Tax=Nocardioides sp. Soil796 TaxID=1736412 RepID=UPI00071054B0|nr:OsmC family protein [Nocardioides sp. Soil796]KRF15929.1 osmotically inducible protein OsmC [Nocardioides sp. Soil796]